MKIGVLFGDRDLSAFDEPVPSADLEVGGTYFLLAFHDRQLLVPSLQPLVFAGWNLSEGDKRCLYFQDYDSYAKGTRFDVINPGEPATFETFRDREPAMIFSYEKAVESLLRCLWRRRV